MPWEADSAEYCSINLPKLEGELRPLVMSWVWICLIFLMHLVLRFNKERHFTLGRGCMWKENCTMKQHLYKNEILYCWVTYKWGHNLINSQKYKRFYSPPLILTSLWSHKDDGQGLIKYFLKLKLLKEYIPV